MDREHRLSRAVEFKQVRSQGRSWAHRLVVLYTLPNGRERSRIGFSVSRRIGKAVVRNRVRRRLREVTRALLERVQPGWDVVVVARSPIVEASFAEIRASLECLFRKAGLLIGPPVWSEKETRRAKSS